MVSGSQSAACFSNRGEFILRVFSQGFVSGSIFWLCLILRWTTSFFYSLRQTSKSLCFTWVSGLESNFYRHHLDPRKVLEEVKTVAARACWKVLEEVKSVAVRACWKVLEEVKRVASRACWKMLEEVKSVAARACWKVLEEVKKWRAHQERVGRCLKKWRA